MVPKPDYLPETRGSGPPEEVRSQSLFPEPNRVRNGRFPALQMGRFIGLFEPVFAPGVRLGGAGSAAYSAASASSDFGFPADIMKSLMRGTISERNRDPLNTP